MERYNYIRYKDGSILKTRIPNTHIRTNNDRNHIVKQGDTLLNIANHYYGNSREYYIIGDVNNIVDPINLEVGSLIIIPYTGKPWKN